MSRDQTALEHFGEALKGFEQTQQLFEKAGAEVPAFLMQQVVLKMRSTEEALKLVKTYLESIENLEPLTTN